MSSSACWPTSSRRRTSIARRCRASGTCPAARRRPSSSPATTTTTATTGPRASSTPTSSRTAPTAARWPTGSACARRPMPSRPRTSPPRRAGLPGRGLRDRPAPARRTDPAPNCNNVTRKAQLRRPQQPAVGLRTQVASLEAPVTQAEPLHRVERLVQRARRSRPSTGSGSTRTTTTGRAAGCRTGPGMFTGSGFPMRFADTDGSLIDVYQAATQLTDESEIEIDAHIDRAARPRARGPGLLRRLHRQHAHRQPVEPRRRPHHRRGAGARRAGRHRQADAHLARRAQRLVLQRRALRRRRTLHFDVDRRRRRARPADDGPRDSPAPHR